MHPAAERRFKAAFPRHTASPERCDVRVDIEKSREISAAAPRMHVRSAAHRGVGSESVVHTDIILIPTLLPLPSGARVLAARYGPVHPKQAS